jgi:pyridoxine 5-phosphate synthase
MSFLNPSAQSPKLGVGIASLLRLRDHNPSANEPDAALAVRAAEEAGADAIILSMSATHSLQERRDIDVLMSAMTEAHLTVPLTPAMIDFAGSIRPYSVTFNAVDISLQLVQQAVHQLQPLSIQVVVAIDPSTDQLRALGDAGVTAVEFTTRQFSQAPAGEGAEALNVLRTAVQAANRAGLDVHLSHGIGYRHITALTELGTIAQMDVDHAITARAIVVGWQTAIREMKALLIATRFPS